MGGGVWLFGWLRSVVGVGSGRRDSRGERGGRLKRRGGEGGGGRRRGGGRKKGWMGGEKMGERRVEGSLNWR